MKFKALLLAMVAMLMMVVTGCGGNKNAADKPASSSSSSSSSSAPAASNSQLTDADYIAMVKGGTLNLNPNVPMGAAFDQFFDGGNGVWTSFISDDADADRIVEFSGDCAWKGKPARMLVQFTVDEANSAFDINYIAIDDVQMTREESTASLKTILDSYKK